MTRFKRTRHNITLTKVILLLLLLLLLHLPLPLPLLLMPFTTTLRAQPIRRSRCKSIGSPDTNSDSVLRWGQDQHGTARWQARDHVEPRRRWDGGADRER